MKILNEFREFALKGSVVDLSVGVVIGASFNKIVGSFIDHIITPAILKPALDADKLNKLEDLTAFGTIRYGMFISSCIDFIVMAVILFLFIKTINTFRHNEELKLTKEEKLLMEIRDLMKNNLDTK